MRCGSVLFQKNLVSTLCNTGCQTVSFSVQPSVGMHSKAVLFINYSKGKNLEYTDDLNIIETGETSIVNNARK